MSQNTSRQVIKKRNGESIPVRLVKKRRINKVLYFDSELKKLDTLLEENDVELEGN